MNSSIVGPSMKEGNKSIEMYYFSRDYYTKLEKLAVGEHITVTGFLSAFQLKDFSRLMLKMDQSPLEVLHPDNRSYEYTIDEKDLEYTVKRAA